MAAVGAHPRSQYEFGSWQAGAALPPAASTSRSSPLGAPAPPSVADRGRTYSDELPRPILRNNTVRVSSPLRRQVEMEEKALRSSRPPLKASHSANASLGGGPSVPSARPRRGRSDHRVAWANTVCDPTDSREELALATGGFATRPAGLQRRRSHASQSDSSGSVTSRVSVSRSLSQHGAPPLPRPKTTLGLWGDLEEEEVPGFGPTHPSTAMPGFPAVEFSDLRAPTFSREALRRGGVVMPTPAKRPQSVAQSDPAPKATVAVSPPSPEQKNGTFSKLARKMSSRRSASQSALPKATLSPPVPPVPPMPTSPASTRVPMSNMGPRSPQTLPPGFAPPAPRSPRVGGSPRRPVASTYVPQHPHPHMLPPQAAAHPSGSRVGPGPTPPRVGGLPPGAGPMLPPGAMAHHPPGISPRRIPMARSPGAPVSGTPMPPHVATPPHVLRAWAPPGQQPLRHYRSTPALGARPPPHGMPPGMPGLQPSLMPAATQSQYRPPHEFAPVPPQMWARPQQATSASPDGFARGGPHVPQLPPLGFTQRKSSPDLTAELEGLEGALGMLCLPDLPSDGDLLPDLPNPNPHAADDKTEPATSDKTISPPGSPKRWPPRASPIERSASVCPPQLLGVPGNRMHPSSAPSTPMLPTTELERESRRPMETLASIETIDVRPSGASVDGTVPPRPARSPLRRRAGMSPSLDSCGDSFNPPPRGMSLYVTLDDDLHRPGAMTPTPTPQSTCSTPPRARPMGRSSSSMSHESSLSLSSESTLSSLTSASSAASVDMPDPIAEDLSEDLHVGPVSVFGDMMDQKMEYDRPRRGEVPRRQVVMEGAGESERVAVISKRAERARSSIAAVVRT